MVASTQWDFWNPFELKDLLWPDVYFYDKEREVIKSVWENDETFVPAANMMGKDYVAGFVAVVYFIVHPVVRVITTSIKDDHLRVLWGEIGTWIQTSRVPLDEKKGGFLRINHREITKRAWPYSPTSPRCEKSYLLGQVSEKGEGMAGHHAPYTLCIGDEASGIDDIVYTQQATWSKKSLWIGNCNDCQNFFRKNVEAGDLVAS